MAAVLVAVLAVVAAVGIVVHDESPAAPVAVESTSATSAGTSGAAVASSAPGGAASTAADPQGPLRALAAADSPVTEGLVGSWVPQLSSKRPGLVVDGQAYDAAAILAEHQALQSRYPDARLVWSGDFANYRGRDFWITLVGERMATAAAANAWCDAQRLDGDHCYAVRLTHSGGPAGNSVMRTGR
jgi:serine/threonine-protein kinase